MDYELSSALLSCEKANTVADFMEAMEYIDLREAELQAFSESADLETMEQYYEEATSANAEKKAGVLKRAWEAIVNLCKQIAEKIQSVIGKKKVDPKKTISINPKDWEIRQKLSEFFKKWGSALSNPKSNPKAFAKAAAALAVVLVSIVAIGKKVVSKGSKKEATANEIGKHLNLFKKATESIRKGANEAKNISEESESHGIVASARQNISKLMNLLGGQTKKLVAEYDRLASANASIEAGGFYKTAAGVSPQTQYMRNAQEMGQIASNKKVARVLDQRAKRAKKAASTVMEM